MEDQRNQKKPRRGSTVAGGLGFLGFGVGGVSVDAVASGLGDSSGPSLTDNSRFDS